MTDSPETFPTEAQRLAFDTAMDAWLTVWMSDTEAEPQVALEAALQVWEQHRPTTGLDRLATAIDSLTAGVLAAATGATFDPDGNPEWCTNCEHDADDHSRLGHCRAKGTTGNPCECPGFKPAPQ